jgi:hypothetical protein
VYPPTQITTCDPAEELACGLILSYMWTWVMLRGGARKIKWGDMWGEEKKTLSNYVFCVLFTFKFRIRYFPFLFTIDYVFRK